MSSIIIKIKTRASNQRREQGGKNSGITEISRISDTSGRTWRIRELIPKNSERISWVPEKIRDHEAGICQYPPSSIITAGILWKMGLFVQLLLVITKLALHMCSHSLIANYWNERKPKLLVSQLCEKLEIILEINLFWGCEKWYRKITKFVCSAAGNKWMYMYWYFSCAYGCFRSVWVQKQEIKEKLSFCIYFRFDYPRYVVCFRMKNMHVFRSVNLDK